MVANLHVEGLWSSIFSNPNVLVIIVNPDGLIIDINRVDIEMKKEDIVGKMRIQDFYPEEEKDIPLNALNSIFNLGHSDHQYDYYSRNDDKYYSSVMMPVKMEGEIVAATIISNDVTEEKKLQEKILRTSKMASMGELAAGVAHETNNPLMIIGFVFESLLQLDPSRSDFLYQFHDLCSKGKEGLSRISKIVSSLTTFSRTQMNLKNISLNRSVLDTVQLFSSLYKKEGIEIEINLTPHEDCFLGDEGKISQIIANFLSNSKDALKETENPVIKIFTQADDEYVTLKVIDNGTGISDDLKRKVFDAFYTTKDAGKGTGLGLSIVRTLAEEMKGVVDLVLSRKGHTEFEVNFKRSKAPDVLQPSQNVLSPDQAKQIGKILIVDDESDITYFLSRSLTLAGVENKFTNKPLEALDLLKNEHFDLVIVDYVMPEMNGLELIRSIVKENILVKNFIILSGFIDLDAIVLKEEFDQNQVTLLKKPITAQKLVKHLLNVTEIK